METSKYIAKLVQICIKPKIKTMKTVSYCFYFL